MTERIIGVGLIGLGVVAGQVARVLTEKAARLSQETGCQLVLRRVKVLPEDLDRPLARQLPRDIFTTNEDEFFDDRSIDIVVEAIGGEHPAYEYQRRALSSGRHVVTPNKEVIAKHGAELLALAQDNDVSLNYEGSVGGGIPLIAPFKYDLVANELSGIYAIINGTTNYILTRMAKEGIDFASALKSAQELGYAEANPADDIEGIDATYKIAILASLGFKATVLPENVYHEGISRLRSRDFLYANELGLTIKLLAIAKQSNGSIEMRVHPALIHADSFLSKVDGVYNAILVEGDLMGKVLFFGEGAGAFPTSSAVVSDIVACARNVATGHTNGYRWQPDPSKKIRPMSEISTRYYLRIDVADQPGVLAQISKVFGDHLISIASVIQKETDESTQTAEVVIMTHPAREVAMQRALAELSKLSVVREISNFIRVEDV
jgi:homoserine dehydrogenase